MDPRGSSTHAQSASPYVAGDARNAGRSIRPMPPRPTDIASPVPTMAPPPPGAAAATAMQRPRVRVGRVPMASLRYEVPAVFDVDDTPMAAAAELEFDGDFQLDDEFRMNFDRSLRAHRRPQRIKYVKCKTRVLPDLLVPYLYAGDRRSRMNAIMDRTGCTIDYCPESPDDKLDMLQPQRSGNLYLMCFLVAAETTGQLEAATRLVHVLVDRVQAHVEYKLAAGAARRTNDVDPTPRQDNRSELLSPEFPPRRPTESEYARLDGIDSDHLKAESIGRADATGTEYERRDGSARTTAFNAGPPEEEALAQEREARWVDETSMTDSHVWYERASTHPNQARARLSSTKFHRPVYRRILVDEAGYEVYERPQYENLQRYSPGHTPSPSLPRRRIHEPMYHGTSSEEESHPRNSAGLSVRSSAPATQRIGSLRDGPNYRSSMHGDVIEHPIRRGMKRRLGAYEVDDMFPRRRTARRGSALYDYMSDELEPDYVLSGDEMVDTVHDDFSSTHAYRRAHQVASSAQETLEPQRVHRNESRDEELRSDCSNQDHVQEMPQIDHSSDPSKPTSENSSVLDATMLDSKVECSSPESSQSKDTVSSNVSISVKPTGVDSSARTSEYEAVVEGAVAPSFMATVVRPSDAPSDKPAHRASAHSRDGEQAINFTAVTSDTRPIHSPMGCSGVDANSGSTRDSQTETGVTNMNEHTRVGLPDRVVSPVPVPGQVAERILPSARTMLNEVMMNRLSSDSLMYKSSRQVFSELIAVARRLTALIDQSRSHEHLQDLAHLAHGVEVDIWRLRSISPEGKQSHFATLEKAITDASDTSKAVSERVSALQNGLEEVISSCRVHAGENQAKTTDCFHGEDDGGEKTKEIRADDHPKSLARLSPGVGCVDVQVKDGAEAAKDGGTKPAEKTKKNKYGSTSPPLLPKLNIPVEAPKFVAGLVAELERTTGLSTVMFSAQKRLLREICKSDPYYYLHPIALMESVRKGRGNSCPYGCAGASAHKWERKVVSQISSRMKWFDSVAYSLAKVSGGKELLSRKKMNSTIRKLHLVALQLHCLIAHLFCIRKRVVCREIDSLPTALNNSYYEKRMNGYKSRLKLTLHQQPPPMSTGISLPTEELVRDTFEFYPELLLSIDIWGYDQRHDQAPTSNLPLDLLRAAARQSFDFESDTNGLLQGICEELLGILCLWNDFKWGESLETLSTDDIVEFEAKVKTSIRKILEAHASHLLSQWSSQLASTPAVLNHIRLTQPNVYYSEHPMSTGSALRSSLVGQNNLLFKRDEEEEDECNEEDRDEEDTILQDFWRNRFTPSTTVDADATTDASDHAKSDESLPLLNLSPLREEVLISVAQETKTDRILTWSEVYDMRQQCHMLAGNTERLLVEDSSPCDVLHLLNHLAQARSIVENAIRTSEKLVLHSVHHQLDEPDAENSHRDAVVGAGSLADVESMSEESRDEEDATADPLLTGKDPHDSAQQNNKTPENGENDSDENAWKQPVLKDLVEIVTSTNQEMSEICGQRARSARVRDKLQSQSLGLARQSIQIFQTILNMKP